MSIHNADVLLQQALAMSVPYRYGRLRTGNRLSAVTLLFQGQYLFESRLLLIKRSERLEHHRGQIAFPGGMADPEDFLSEGLKTTALRELREEVGIGPEKVRLLGDLPELDTTTGFTIRPFVGRLADEYPHTQLEIDEGELEQAFWVGWNEWVSPQNYREETIKVGQSDYPIDVFYLQGHRVWGATGSILKNMLDRLKAIGQE